MVQTLHQRRRWSVFAWISLLLLIAYGSVYASGTAPTATPAAASVVLSGQTSGVTALAWSPDGKLLASAAGGFNSSDGTVRLWRADGTVVSILSGQSAAVVSLAWSPDGKVLAAGGFDQKIVLWSADGTLIRMIDANTGIVFKLAWSPDGTVLASGSVSDPTHNTVQWWSADGSLLITRTTDYSGGKFYNLGWSPDGKFLVGGATSYTEWRADGTIVFSNDACASCTPAWGFGWSPDGSRWAIGNEGGNVTIYANDGKQIASVWDSYGGANALAWSPDGKTLAGGDLSLWSMEGELMNADNLSPENVTVLAWSPDGQRLAGGTNYDNNVHLWGAGLQPFAPLKGHDAPISSLAWSPDGTTLASGSLDQTIRLWHIPS